MSTPDAKYHDLDKQIAVLEAKTGKDIEAIEKARQIQATIYEGRLTALNGEYKRIDTIISRCVTREMHDAHREETRADINKFNAFMNNSLGRQSVTAIVVVIIVELAMHLFFKG